VYVDPQGLWVTKVLQMLLKIIKEAVKFCRKIRCNIKYDPPHHTFPIIGKACHLQLNCWIKGKKNSHINIRIPVPCWGKNSSNANSFIFPMARNPIVIVERAL
jgi:hypothetical protein